MVRYIDISVPLFEGLPVWPGDPAITIEPFKSIAKGDKANITLLGLATHVGTHVDAPLHVLSDGKPLDTIPFETWCGPCWVADLTQIDGHITAEDLAASGIPEGTERLLLKTTNSGHWNSPDHEFNTSFIGVTPSGAEWLVEHGIKLVGIDYHSIEPYGSDGTTHQILLGNELVILEILDLRAVQSGRYDLLCLPLNITGGDGSPARAVLVEHASESL